MSLISFLNVIDLNSKPTLNENIFIFDSVKNPQQLKNQLQSEISNIRIFIPNNNSTVIVFTDDYEALFSFIKENDMKFPILDIFLNESLANDYINQCNFLPNCHYICFYHEFDLHEFNNISSEIDPNDIINQELAFFGFRSFPKLVSSYEILTTKYGIWPIFIIEANVIEEQTQKDEIRELAQAKQEFPEPNEEIDENFQNENQMQSNDTKPISLITQKENVSNTQGSEKENQQTITKEQFNQAITNQIKIILSKRCFAPKLGLYYIKFKELNIKYRGSDENSPFYNILQIDDIQQDVFDEDDNKFTFIGFKNPNRAVKLEQYLQKHIAVKNVMLQFQIANFPEKYSVFYPDENFYYIYFQTNSNKGSLILEKKKYYFGIKTIKTIYKNYIHYLDGEIYTFLSFDNEDSFQIAIKRLSKELHIKTIEKEKFKLQYTTNKKELNITTKENDSISKKTDDKTIASSVKETTFAFPSKTENNKLKLNLESKPHSTSSVKPEPLFIKKPESDPIDLQLNDKPEQKNNVPKLAEKSGNFKFEKPKQDLKLSLKTTNSHEIQEPQTKNNQISFQKPPQPKNQISIQKPLKPISIKPKTPTKFEIIPPNAKRNVI